MSRSTKKHLLLSIMGVVLIAGGFIAFQFSPFGASAQMPEGEMPPMPVPVVTIEEKPIEIWKEFSGRLSAVDYVEIRPQVSGLITKVHFEDGQIVKKGDLLYSIDSRPYDAAVAQARAEVAAAKDDAEFAQSELARAEELLKTGAVSKQGYDERVNSLKVNKSASAGANARLKAALVDLDNATIKAPVSGRISRPEITEGNLVSAATAPLLTTIVSDKEIYGDFEVDEQTYLSFVRTGGQDVASEKSMPVRLVLDSDKEKFYDGVIKSFDNKINPSSGTIRARAVFPNENNALLPGMFAKVQIGSASKEARMTVPEKAVLTDQSRKFVYVVTDGAATYREVKLGDSVAGSRIILSGLQAGDKVIIDNLMKLRPGAKVQAMTPEELAAMKEQMAQQQGAPPAATEAPKEEVKPEAAVAEPAADAPLPEVTDEKPALVIQQEIPFDEPETPAAEQAPEQE